MDKHVSRVKCYLFKYIKMEPIMKGFLNLDSVDPRPVDKKIWINL